MRKNEVFDGQGNVIESVEVPYTEEELAAHLPAYRWQVENGGITINGVAVPTDRETQAKLIAMRILAKEDSNYTVDFKTPNGFVNLNAATIITIADAVGAHVQKCFSAEAVVNPSDHDTIAELEAAFDTAYNSE